MISRARCSQPLLHIEKIGLKVFWRILHHNDADEVIRCVLYAARRTHRVGKSAVYFDTFYYLASAQLVVAYFESTKRKFGKVGVTIMRSWLRREIQPLFTWPRPMSERDFQIPLRAATEQGPYLELRKWNRQRIFATSIVTKRNWNEK